MLSLFLLRVGYGCKGESEGSSPRAIFASTYGVIGTKRFSTAGRGVICKFLLSGFGR